MTVKQLIKALEKTLKEHGNVQVGIDWQTLRDESNGVYDIASPHKVEVQIINIVDGDGFHVENKDGTERTRKTAVIT